MCLLETVEIMDAKDRPEWMEPLYIADATQRLQNWKDIKVTKDQLATLGSKAWNFYWALVKYNTNAQQLRSTLPRDQGFKLLQNAWHIVAEVDNGGWAQYWWNMIADGNRSLSLKELVEDSIHYMGKLFDGHSISEEEFQKLKHKTRDPAKLVEQAADTCNWALLLKEMEKSAKGRTENERLEPFSVCHDICAFNRCRTFAWKAMTISIILCGI